MAYSSVFICPIINWRLIRKQLDAGVWPPLVSFKKTFRNKNRTKHHITQQGRINPAQCDAKSIFRLLNASSTSSFHPVTPQTLGYVGLRGINNKRLVHYHYYYFGCMPETLHNTLHGRQIGIRNSGVMEVNCLNAGLPCTSCKSPVHSGETWLINRTGSRDMQAWLMFY